MLTYTHFSRKVGKCEMYENENWTEEERNLALGWRVVPVSVLTRVMLQLLHEHELINNAMYIASLKKLQEEESRQ